MAQWLKALAAFLEGLGSIPSIHMAAHTCLQPLFEGIQLPNTCRQNIFMYIKYIKMNLTPTPTLLQGSGFIWRKWGGQIVSQGMTTRKLFSEHNGHLHIGIHS